VGVAVNTTPIDDKVYRLMPALGINKSVCIGCSFLTGPKRCSRPDNWDPPTYKESCGQSDIVYVEYTDEAMAKYVAARMNT
jgi:hypothetical protein